MTAFRPPLPRPARVRTPGTHGSVTAARPAAALAAACCLLAVVALPAAAATGPGSAFSAARSSSGSSQSAAGSPSAAVGGALLGEPGVQVQPRAGAPELPSDLSALSWTVSDARTGQVLAAKDAHRRLPPASTLKTLFAVTVLPRFPSGTTHKVTDADLAGIGEGSSMVGVQPGRTYTVADLWRGVFLCSGNDAVHVLAHMNGSVAQTVTQMQAKARMLGADDTHVVSPDGYDEPGQVSSAYDLAVFARAGLANPDFAGYASTATARFPSGPAKPGDSGESFGIQNTNRLLTGAQGVTPYPGVIGVKNGYTTNAGNTLIAAARRDGRTLIVTVMNPQSGVPQAVYTEATELLDWGFAAAGRTTSVGTLNAARTAAFTATAARAPHAAAQHSPATESKVAPSADSSDGGSPAAWYVGGTLALTAVLSVVVLRRRATARPH
jgi:D-alanyl-D-alanine carboxypeptidase (penicillin-binding protein 5/6)